MTETKLGKSAPLSIAIFGLMFLSLAFSTPTSGADSFNPFQPPHSIEVRVCYSDDTPVVGASVTLSNTNKTGKEVQGTTDENGEWSVEVTSTIDAQTGDEIVITASISAEETQSEILVVYPSESEGKGPQEVNFVFEKQSGSSGDGGSGGSSSGGTTAVPTPTPAETETNAAVTDTDTEQQPSPSQSASIEGKDESATPSPLLEDGEEGAGKTKGIPGFQIVYAGLAGLIAIAALFSIRKLRRSRGGEKR